MVCECVVLRNQERGVDCDFISWIVTLLWRDTHGFHNVTFKVDYVFMQGRCWNSCVMSCHSELMDTTVIVYLSRN